jgi:hypothetical protein
MLSFECDIKRDDVQRCRGSRWKPGRVPALPREAPATRRAVARGGPPTPPHSLEPTGTQPFQCMTEGQSRTCRRRAVKGSVNSGIECNDVQQCCVRRCKPGKECQRFRLGLWQASTQNLCQTMLYSMHNKQREAHMLEVCCQGQHRQPRQA